MKKKDKVADVDVNQRLPIVRAIQEIDTNFVAVSSFVRLVRRT